MNFFNLLAVGSILVVSGSYADGFGFNIGPFDLHFNVDGPYRSETLRGTLNDPICSAIVHRNRLEIIVEGAEKINSKELKVVTKKLIVEPHAFGVTQEGVPILHGDVINEKLVKEVTIRYGEDQFDEMSNPPDQKRRGYLSGFFKSDKNHTIDIRKVSDLQILTDSHFDAPRNYKGVKEENVRVICELPIISD